ncbi:maestro heat-like repeat family member 5 [Falco peregrinus]|uniref:maestro heat-like repeat family member 5 n=1 Tax=Falco peregrinus TaxID=8954 RepID=UPI00247A45F2|nr:maestro heat-like repeat family member 5 [Falco peregrinus]
MMRRSPRFPSVAWEKDGAPQESRSPPEPHEVCVVQPLVTDASWLPVYTQEKQSVDFIQAFASSPEKEEGQKMKFLESICSLCRTAKHHGLSQGLDIFCHGYELAEKVKELVEQEPRDQLRTAVRQLAMLAIAELSSVQTVLEGKEKSSLHACCLSVLGLPPAEEMEGLDTSLYFRTLNAMDTMLETMVLSSPASRVSKENLQSIFQVLLAFTSSERPAVLERTVGRIRMLSHLLASYSSLEAAQNEDRHASCREILIPVLGQLLGRLLLLVSSGEEKTSRVALDALFSLFLFTRQQKCTTLSEENAQLPAAWEAETTSLCCSPTARDFAMAFAKYLQPSERTDIVLTIIDTLRELNAKKKPLGSSVMDVVMADPHVWLTDVPKIMSCIYESWEYVTMESGQRSMESLLLLMANQCPGDVVTTLLKIAPRGDSTALALWEVMLSTAQTLEKVLKELFIKLQDRQNRLFYTYQEDTCFVRLALLTCTDLEDEEFSPMYKVLRFLRDPSPAVLSLVLRSLMTLSERAEMARKMEVFMPDMMKVLEDGNTNIKMKSLVVSRNVIGHLKTKASPIAVQLMEKLLPLFAEGFGEVRELSISLFRDLMKTVVRKNKRQMKTKVEMGLLPLIFHMSDQIHSVAKASREALLAAAELLKWKKLKHLLQSHQTWRIAECLLQRDRRRTEEYLNQSLPYLEDAQATLRATAVRFIGLAGQLLKDQREEKLAEICHTLQTLEEDNEPSICSLAAQTTSILSTPRVRQTSRCTLRSLCCWCC